MEKKITSLWYASYGSNLLGERFSCYISGGTPKGAQRRYIGCTDTSPPIASKPVIINAELYFARRSKTWSAGGAAFIKPEIDKAVTTLGRMYLITAEQFMEVLKQETRFEGALTIDFMKAIKEGALNLRERSWYSKLMYLGTDEGFPIFTFTNRNFLAEEINPPHEHYLKIIIAGLRETHGLRTGEIEEYLRSKTGIRGTVMEERLPELASR